MNPDLEALLKAYDAAFEAGKEELEERQKAFERLLAALLERHPALSKTGAEAMIQKAYRGFRSAQRRTSTLPPKA